ncbi:hypothetical protein KCMC57_up47040 [Kitasatospora sp. CMC57]|uniref:Uncharacterized protein n=1 Tax=Kitasatospora sp. CMC57 TaxID=3231513 RepID=A0AB33K4B6_9ACTN
MTDACHGLADNRPRRRIPDGWSGQRGRPTLLMMVVIFPAALRIRPIGTEQCASCHPPGRSVGPPHPPWRPPGNSAARGSGVTTGSRRATVFSHWVLFGPD